MTEIFLDRDAMALFEAMLEAAPIDPEAWIAEQAGDRRELAARTLALLAADRIAILRTGGAVDTIEEPPPPETLGGYRLIEKIGHGGMGSVYRAQRERGDFAHYAAVKIIKPGLLSERLVDRFRRERQTLAQLSHPNIAQLFDGGETEDGSPYIIMEYIDGQPLLEWTAERASTRKAKTGLFLQICGAVAFAHRNLIVHRDITPSNVLVTRDGLVKLIDFGIARAVEAGEAVERRDAAPSLQSLSLTPGYAAPERMTGAEATTLADIYSLGKLLAKLMEGETADTELAAIIARATAPAPQDRYGTVEKLAADIEAWRDGRPVAAHGLTTGYVFGKFIGRHSLATGAVVAVLVLLVGAFAATAISYVRAETARAAEAKRFEDVRALAHYLVFDLNDRLRGVPGNTAARADLAARAQTYLEALEKTSDASQDLRLETAQGFIRLAEIQGSPLDRNLGEGKLARKNLDSARALLADLRADAGDTPDIAIAEGRLEGVAALSIFYHDGAEDAAADMLAKAEAAMARVPAEARDEAWRMTAIDISRARMDFHSSNEQTVELKAAVDKHDAMVAGWPADLQGSDIAVVQRAYADYYRGVSLEMSDDDAGALPPLIDAYRGFVAAEKKKPNDPDLLYWIGWAGAEVYAVGSRLDREEEFAPLFEVSVAAAEKLVAIQDLDESSRVLRVAVAETWAQHLSNVGRHAEAIAQQQAIVDDRLKAFEDYNGPDGGTGADVGWSEMILGLLARKAGDRALTCSTWEKANAHFTPVEQAGRLIEFHAGFLPGLRKNLELCRAGKPLADFGPLR